MLVANACAVGPWGAEEEELTRSSMEVQVGLCGWAESMLCNGSDSSLQRNLKFRPCLFSMAAMNMTTYSAGAVAEAALHQVVQKTGLPEAFRLKLAEQGVAELLVFANIPDEYLSRT